MKPRNFLTLALLLTASAYAATPPTDQAPFRPGEVAVYATPQVLTGEHLVKFLPNAGISVVSSPAGKELAAVQRFTRRGLVAGLNRIAHATATPNDPFYSFQWHFENVQAPAAWDISTGTGVTVAVLDTGLKLGGSDGISCVVSPRDVVNSDFDPDDGDGHGTHVAGTVAQSTNNSTGVAGLAYDSCVMPVKVLDDDGSGSFADIADGIYYASDNGAKVINMSLSTNARFGLRNDPIMDAALDYADAAGVTVVAASGNDGHRKNVGYPAIYPSVIAVGATDFADKVTRYSNKGEGLDMVAPGGDTGKDLNGDGYGDGVLQETDVGSGFGYYFFSGTSMASPHVAAAAAQLISAGVATTPDEVFSALTLTTKDLSEAGYDTSSGHGLLQVENALLGITNEPPPPPDPDPSCTDSDGDGFCVVEGDCDDTNAHVYPGHQDSKGRWGRDGVDNDCNGIIDG